MLKQITNLYKAAHQSSPGILRPMLHAESYNGNRQIFRYHQKWENNVPEKLYSPADIQENARTHKEVQDKSKSDDV